MKKCPNCSKEIPNQAIKCIHCGKLIDILKGSEGIWNRYWVHILSIPIIIVCVAYIISSIANLTKSNELASQDSYPLIAEQSASRSPDANYQITRQSSSPPEIDNRPVSGQPATVANDRQPSPGDEAGTMQPVDTNYQIARHSSTASKIDNRQTSGQPATKVDDRKPSPNDETYKPSSETDEKRKSQNQKRLHEQQKRQLESLYR